WNIDVRPDWQGLPPGSGSVAQGQVVWEAQCASCHGSFGESNQVFTPITGGTTRADIVSGRVAALANNSQPQRSSLMKLATLSTLFDYIRRAMPWNAPKTLSNDQVYAVTAYILNLGDIVPDDFVLSDKNIAQVQLPNRHGLQRNHGMWQVNGKGDVVNVACMQNCAVGTEVRSFLPASARNAHGNLALQQRSIGPNRGVDTASASDKANSSNVAAAALPHPGAALAQQYACNGCHAGKEKLVGPAFAAIAAKYRNQQDALGKLTLKMQNGGSGTWGEIAMPPQSHVPAGDVKALLQWILAR
ncbi:MAG: hypothetical protein RL748_2320, partial [Pseudomonadota bacterium]